jgi:hypothetical protein
MLRAEGRFPVLANRDKKTQKIGLKNIGFAPGDPTIQVGDNTDTV